MLGRGFTVIGTTRSDEKGDYLKDLYKSDKFSYVIVKDLEDENAFDEHVKGVDAVVHIASVCPLHSVFCRCADILVSLSVSVLLDNRECGVLTL